MTEWLFESQKVPKSALMLLSKLDLLSWSDCWCGGWGICGGWSWRRGCCGVIRTHVAIEARSGGNGSRRCGVCWRVGRCLGWRSCWGVSWCGCWGIGWCDRRCGSWCERWSCSCRLSRCWGRSWSNGWRVSWCRGNGECWCDGWGRCWDTSAKGRSRTATARGVAASRIDQSAKGSVRCTGKRRGVVPASTTITSSLSVSRWPRGYIGVTPRGEYPISVQSSVKCSPGRVSNGDHTIP
jgi:hypothetical protein